MRWSTLNVALAIVMLAGLFVGALTTFVDPDLYHCLAFGRELARTGRFPYADVFAYTPTRPMVVHHEWAVALLHWAVVDRFGGTGLQALRFLVEGGAVGGALVLACRRGAGVPVLAVLGPLAVGPLGFLAPGLTLLRAQAWTLLFTTAVLWLVEADRRGGRRWVAGYLALHVVWLNVHGGFVVGMALLLAHAAEAMVSGRPWRHLVWTLAAAAALTVASPYGTAYPAYLWEALRLDRSVIGEWRPSWERGPFALLAWSTTVAVLAYAIRRIGFRAAEGWGPVVATALAALRYQRHVSIYGIVWLALVPPMVQRARLGAVVERVWRERRRLVAALLAVAAVGAWYRALAAAPWRVRVPAVVCERNCGSTPVWYPVGPVRYLADIGFRGNAFVPFEAGAYVSWNLYPRVRVSIDGRWEAAYPPDLLYEHIRFYAAAPGWRDVRAAYPTDVVIAARDRPVARAMETEGTWPVAYEDEVWVVFARPGLDLPPRTDGGPAVDGAFP